MRLKLDSDTKLLFQIGDPLDFCAANYIHNAMYSYANLNAVSVNCVVKKGDLAKFVEAAKTVGAFGFDCTMPHKSDIIEFLDECDEASRAFRAVNHVRIENGKLSGIGLDGYGMAHSIERRTGFGNIKERTVLIIGGGAVAGPIAADLARRGANRFYIANRTEDKARYIADTLARIYNVKAEYGGFTDEYLCECAPKADIAVQCTPLGGYGWEEFPLLSFVSLLKKDCLCADVLFPRTTFLDEAERLGLKTVNGRGMLYEQQLGMMEFLFGIKLGEDALREAEEAVDIAVAINELRNARLRGEK